MNRPSDAVRVGEPSTFPTSDFEWTNALATGLPSGSRTRPDTTPVGIKRISIPSRS